jgi:hypothetical protein
MTSDRVDIAVSLILGFFMVGCCVLVVLGKINVI